MTQDFDPLEAAADLATEPLDSGQSDLSADDSEPREDGPSTARRRSNLTRAQVRRIVSKTLEVQAAPEDIRALVAAALGVDDELNDLVPAIVSSNKQSIAVFSEINEISAADPMEAVVLAASHDRDRLRAMHRVLQQVGAADVATLSPADVKAGMTIAKAAQSLNYEQVSCLTGAAALVGN